MVRKFRLTPGRLVWFLSLALVLFSVPQVRAVSPPEPQPYSKIALPNAASDTRGERVVIYTVAPGDTLWDVAVRFGLDVDTLRWSNPDLRWHPDQLSPGQELVIPPVDGAYHTVQEGETLSGIAQQYNASVEDIAQFPLNALTEPYALVPGQHLIIPGGRAGGEGEGVITYTVSSGDTVSEIAARFGLDVDTVRWANPELANDPDTLELGQALVILPVDGVYHTVQKGETLSEMARRYGVATEDISGFFANGLTDPDDLTPGQHLIIPGGQPSRAPVGGSSAAEPAASASASDSEAEAPPERDAPAGGNSSQGVSFAWPVAGDVTQWFGYGHIGLDVGGDYGSDVHASADGKVVYVGWKPPGYGYSVMLSHANGLETLYAHLKEYTVSVGQEIEQGHVIGKVGVSGRSTGPHVHFEIRKDGLRLDPARYLP